MRDDSSRRKNGITINVIKKIKENICDILVNIYNNILVENGILESFKIDLVTPMYKEGNKLNILKYVD